MLKFYVIAVLIVSVLFLQIPTASQAQTSPLVTMANTTHGNALNGQVQVTPLGGNCYFPIIINVTITFNGNGLYEVGIAGFTLITLSASSFYANATNFNEVIPNNRIGSFILTQQNNVATVELTFSKICIFGTLVKAVLQYNDGENTFNLIN